MRSITIKDIKLHPIVLPLVEQLQTSFGNEPVKAAVLVELITEEGVTGWGECSVEMMPAYSAETIGTTLHLLGNFIIPSLIGKTLENPTDLPSLITLRGNHHAKHGIDGAVWDAFARANDMRLVDLFSKYLPEGHESRGYAVVGVSIGIQESLEATIGVIQKRLDQGYRRIKLKIKPGWDVEFARNIRKAFPNVSIMLDANSAYTLADADHLKQLDEFDLLMIEQPLREYDIYEHSKLQPQLKTAICLDESIKTANDFQTALALGAFRILNLKPSRMGGFTESLATYRLCVENNFDLWIGGMLETGVGRAANVAFASLPGVTLPSDISATDRYFAPDITEPPFVLQPESRLNVPDGPGTGVEVEYERVLEAVARWRETVSYAYIQFP